MYSLSFTKAKLAAPLALVQLKFCSGILLVLLAGCETLKPMVTTYGMLKSQYEAQPGDKILMSCSDRLGLPGAGVAYWGAVSVYAAKRGADAEADRLKLDNCKIANINGQDASDVVWTSDPSSAYSSAKEHKVLLSCEFGVRVAAWEHPDPASAKAKALERAARYGVAPCQVVSVNGGKYTLDGKPKEDKHSRRIAAATSPEKIAEIQMASSAGWTSETFNIGLLKIVVKTRKLKNSICIGGALTKFELTGTIGPDSTFAMTKLLERNPPCLDTNGNVPAPTVINLNSKGGLLVDGYMLGRTFRRLGVTVEVADGDQCASSCAVAFLGGAKRLVQEDATILFHAPYFTGENSYGKRDISCDIGEEALSELNAYYREMTNNEVGDRLFDRTMWYCSAEFGWEIKGGSAAELYGIATEK